MLAGAAWRRISWRLGTKGPLAAEFAALRVRPAEGAQLRDGRHLPGDEVWLVGEHRASGEQQVLPLQPARGDPARGAGGHDQGALGVRAGAPAAEGGARPRPLRGPLLDRPAPARADDHDRVRVPPAPAARGAGKKATPAHRDRRPSRPCPRCGACSSSGSGAARPAARVAAARSTRPCPVKCPGSAEHYPARTGRDPGDTDVRPQAFRQRSGDGRALLARPSGLRARLSAAARRLLGHLRRDVRQPALEAASLESMGRAHARPLPN